MNFNSLLVIPMFLCGAYVTPALATYEKELATVDQWIKERKYQTAAEFIHRHKLNRDPRFTRRYVHVLARRYVATTRFSTFLIKDLAPDEEVDSLRREKNIAERGAVKKYVLDIDEFLYQQLKKYPESIDIQFAIGDYLSSYVQCRCHTTKYFHGKGDAGFYVRAYDAGVYDDWSLLRIGRSLLYARNSETDGRAIGFLKMSHDLNPGDLYATYYLGVAYYHQRDLENANEYAARVLGKFASPVRNADAYDIYGQINRDLGRDEVAEESFRRALGYAKGHKESFSSLLRLYVANAENEKYRNEVKRYIAQDYADQELIGNYVYYLQKYGMSEVDSALVESLGSAAPGTPMEVGVLNFNLGFIYQNFGDAAKARQHYGKSLTGFQGIKEPPHDSIEEVHRMLSWLGKER